MSVSDFGGTQLSPIPSVGLSVYRSGKYCGKTAHWVRIPFGVVSGVSRGMGVLDGVVMLKGKGHFGVNLGRPIVTSEDGDALFSN